MLEGTDYDKIKSVYEVSAHAIDSKGRNVTVYLNKRPDIESGPPYYWDDVRSGYQFEVDEHAALATRGATFTTYSIKSVDKESIQVLEYLVKMKKETSFVKVIDPKEFLK